MDNNIEIFGTTQTPVYVDNSTSNATIYDYNKYYYTNG